MKISIQESAVRPGTYRVVLHTGQRAAFEDFIRHVEESSTITRADALAVLTAAADWLQQQAARGREVDLGPLGRSRLGMKGVFTSIPERIEDADVTLNVAWILPRALKRAVAQAGRDLIRERVAPAPKQPHIAEARRILAGGVPDPHPGRYTPGEPLRLYGARIAEGRCPGKWAEDIPRRVCCADQFQRREQPCCEPVLTQHQDGPHSRPYTLHHCVCPASSRKHDAATGSDPVPLYTLTRFRFAA